MRLVCVYDRFSPSYDEQFLVCVADFLLITIKLNLAATYINY